MEDKNKTESLVSVGMPTYNRPEGLWRTLERIDELTERKRQIFNWYQGKLGNIVAVHGLQLSVHS